MDRRQFVKTSTAGMGTLAAGLGIKDGVEPSLAAEPGSVPAVGGDKIGRPVRVVSIGFTQGHSLDEIAGLVDKEGAGGTDLIVLPETWRGQDEKSTETLEGPTITTIARLAQKHQTYVVCPIDRKEGERRYNSAVLLDRKGHVVSLYNKLYPVWQVECMKESPQQAVLPGEDVTVHQADFGRIGMAICFDVNWASLWERMANQGAELVIWPSAYSAGRSLQAQAICNNYYIVSATWVPDCRVFDIDGEQLVHDQNNQGNGVNITRVTLDLDRCIFHQDLNVPEKRDKLLKDRGDDVAQEKWMPMEGWFVLKAKRPGVSARELAREYGMEELGHYINRSRCEIDKCRGWEFHS
ncbi:MAG: carbon-nitrogen hydrolase family protein [Terriglobia bacterium]